MTRRTSSPDDRLDRDVTQRVMALLRHLTHVHDLGQAAALAAVFEAVLARITDLQGHHVIGLLRMSADVLAAEFDRLAPETTPDTDHDRIMAPTIAALLDGLQPIPAKLPGSSGVTDKG